MESISLSSVFWNLIFLVFLLQIQLLILLDKYTFGVYGCWVMDDDGNLDYVPEEEYTEELWNEQKKSAERNRAAGLHK